MKDFTEKTLSSETIYEGRLFDVRKDIVELPDGKASDREYILHPGAVMIVPLIEPASVLLERQYRYPLHQHFYELPAGKREAGEDPALTAKRELLEETGYVAEVWRHLGTLHPSVGYSDEVVELYFAASLRFQEQNTDEGEFLEVLTLPLEEAFEWVKAKKITEVKTILGLLWLDRILQGRAWGEKSLPRFRSCQCANLFAATTTLPYRRSAARPSTIRAYRASRRATREAATPA